MERKEFKVKEISIQQGKGLKKKKLKTKKLYLYNNVFYFESILNSISVAY